jgi:hypothetical protein
MLCHADEGLKLLEIHDFTLMQFWIASLDLSASMETP